MFLIFFTSCKVTETSIVGEYAMKHFPKATLTLKSDNTFEFISNYHNPYLLPFEHPDEKYFRTTGQWKLNDKTIILNSIKDSLTYPLYNIETTDKSSSGNCNYVFYDTYNDTVPILFVRTNDGDVARFHSSMEDFSWKSSKKDTLQFFFFGYNPLTIINSQNGEKNYKINLQPEFRPNWFKEAEFKVAWNKVIQLKSKTYFKKQKNKR